MPLIKMALFAHGKDHNSYELAAAIMHDDVGCIWTSIYASKGGFPGEYTVLLHKAVFDWEAFQDLLYEIRAVCKRGAQKVILRMYECLVCTETGFGIYYETKDSVNQVYAVPYCKCNDSPNNLSVVFEIPVEHGELCDVESALSEISDWCEDVFDEDQRGGYDDA